MKFGRYLFIIIGAIVGTLLVVWYLRHREDTQVQQLEALHYSPRWIEIK